MPLLDPQAMSIALVIIVMIAGHPSAASLARRTYPLTRA
jgi:hypothetical protein